MIYSNWITMALHVIITFALTIGIGKIGLPLLKKIKAGQVVRDEGPKSHQAKTGTPTMGGWFFILSILIVAIFSNVVLGGTPVSLWFYVGTLVSYAAIGFADDYLKVVKKHNLGLTSKQKILAQVAVVVLLFVVFRDHFQDVSIYLGFTSIAVPWVVYLGFAAFWFVGFSNATNVTDGLDGLLGTTSAIAFAALGIIALLLGHFGTATFCFIAFGGMLGFLVFNRHPAQVFMGDTGSLAIGALLAAISLELNIDFLLLVIGIVFVIETTSVILQVSYFKVTKKIKGEGKRIFLMSPYHHHLELKGLKETTVVKLLSVLGLVGGIAGVLIVYFTLR